MDINTVKDIYFPVLRKHIPGAEVEVIGESYLKTHLGPWSLWLLLDTKELGASRGKYGVTVKLCVGPHYYLHGSDGIPKELTAAYGWPLNMETLDKLVALAKAHLRDQARHVIHLCGAPRE